MRTWADLKQATLDKLNLTQDEALQEGHLEKMVNLANECINTISNSVKPKVKKLELTITLITEDNPNVKNDFLLEYFGEIVEEVIYKDFYVYKVSDDSIHVFTEDFEGKRFDFTMPNDFISFTDNVNYLDGEKTPKIFYLTYNTIGLNKTGKYEIFYNSLWEEIQEDDENSNLNIDISILNCVPTYVASQLLSQDDPQRSGILRNEFELMFARLDNNTLNEEQSFKSIGGWY